MPATIAGSDSRSGDAGSAMPSEEMHVAGAIFRRH